MVKVGSCHTTEVETGEQTRKRIVKERKEALEASSGRGQKNERWRKLMAKVRWGNGTKPKETRNNESGRSAMSKDFSEAKERRNNEI